MRICDQHKTWQYHLFLNKFDNSIFDIFLTYETYVVQLLYSSWEKVLKFIQTNDIMTMSILYYTLEYWPYIKVTSSRPWSTVLNPNTISIPNNNNNNGCVLLKFHNRQNGKNRSVVVLYRRWYHNILIASARALIFKNGIV